MIMEIDGSSPGIENLRIYSNDNASVGLMGHIVHIGR